MFVISLRIFRGLVRCPRLVIIYTVMNIREGCGDTPMLAAR